MCAKICISKNYRGENLCEVPRLVELDRRILFANTASLVHIHYALDKEVAARTMALGTRHRSRKKD